MSAAQVKARPKWQRAKVIRSPKGAEVLPVGHVLWVELGPPEPSARSAVVFRLDGSLTPGLAIALTTHYFHPRWQSDVYDAPVRIAAGCLELLARSPDDFADHVDREPWPWG